MVKNLISSVHIKDEKSLQDYYNNCGLAPALTFESARKFDYKKTTYSLGDVQLCTTSSISGWGFEKQVATDVYFISFTYAGLSAWEMNKLGRVKALQQMCIIDSSRLVQGQFNPGTSTDTIVIDAKLIHKEFSALRGYPVLKRIDFEPVLPKNSQAWNYINCIAGAIKSGFNFIGGDCSPLSGSYLKQALLTSVLETVPSNQGSIIECNTKNNLPRHISRAIDYMYAHAAEPILLADISINAHSSIRNLQIGFKKYKETTPMRYLRMIRLARVRSDLISHDVLLPWQTVAAQWGFSDMQLFTRYYQQVYHETPFKTVYRCKGGAMTT
ncbi:helix-turn-helix transcriptional regulator [Pseudomonas sp. NFX5]|uniref:helix-turn-helix transcriptional regulator n=1 Tax=Pseudomonas sp. NFX5 TaxID=2816961 RepID=UPI003B8E514C